VCLCGQESEDGHKLCLAVQVERESERMQIGMEPWSLLGRHISHMVGAHECGEASQPPFFVYILQSEVSLQGANYKVQKQGSEDLLIDVPPHHAPTAPPRPPGE